MTTINDICRHLENFAPLAYQEPYDNAGLLTGNRHSEVTGVLVAVDVTEAIIKEAVERKCNMVVAHHPFIFSGLKKITGSSYVEKTLIAAIKNDIAVYAFHTNLDNMMEGVSKKICDKIGLVNTKVLAPKSDTLRKLYTFAPNDKAGEIRDALFIAGAGHIGNYANCSFNAEGTGTFRGLENSNPYVGQTGVQHHESETRIEVVFPIHLEKSIIAALIEAHPYEEVAYDIIALENTSSTVGAGMIGNLQEPIGEKEFLNGLKLKMNTQCIRHTQLTGNMVSKVAVCGGSGSFLLPNAIHEGADIFISADFKYHQFFDADKKIVIADIGHYESEQFTTDLIHELLSKKFTNFAVLFTGLSTNPIKYLT